MVEKYRVECISVTLFLNYHFLHIIKFKYTPRFMCLSWQLKLFLVILDLEVNKQGRFSINSIQICHTQFELAMCEVAASTTVQLV